MAYDSAPFSREGVVFYPYSDIWAAVSWTSDEVVFLSDVRQETISSVLSALHPVHETLPPPWRGLCLYITTKCNLACLYCYARGGESSQTMPWEVAKTAMDYYLWRNTGNLSLTFHGAGEPTLELDLIQRCCQYLEARAHERLIRYSIITNGVVSARTLDWLLAKNFRFSISLDGIPEVQNKQRPLRGGGPSSRRVEETVKRVVQSGLPYSVNAVFTSETYDFMSESVRYFAGLGVRYARLRHAFICGRCHDNEIKDISIEAYLRNLQKAKNVAQDLGVKIAIPGYNMPFPHRCGIATGYFAGVSHEGFVTGCTEVTSRRHPAFSTFILGEVDTRSGNVNLDDGKIALFRERSYEDSPTCRGCVMRDYCNGGCMMRCWEYSSDINTPDPIECRRSQELFLSYIREIIEATIHKHYPHTTEGAVS